MKTTEVVIIPYTIFRLNTAIITFVSKSITEFKLIGIIWKAFISVCVYHRGKRERQRERNNSSSELWASVKTQLDCYFRNIFIFLISFSFFLFFFFYCSKMDGPAVLSMPPITAAQKSAQSPQPQSHSKSNQVSYVFLYYEILFYNCSRWTFRDHGLLSRLSEDKTLPALFLCLCVG